MDIGTAITIAIPTSTGIVAFLIAFFRLRGEKTKDSASSNGYQTNKQVNITVTDRLKQWRDLMCEPTYREFEKDMDGLREEIKDSEDRMKERIDTVEKGLRDKMDTQYNFTNQRFDDVLNAIAKITP